MNVRKNGGFEGVNVDFGEGWEWRGYLVWRVWVRNREELFDVGLSDLHVFKGFMEEILEIRYMDKSWIQVFFVEIFVVFWLNF